MYRPLRLLSGVALALLAPGVATADESELKGKAPLVRPPVAPDADAKGYIELSHEPGDEDELEVEISKVDPGLPFDLYIEDTPGSGTLVLAGRFELDDDDDDDDELEIEFETESDEEDDDDDEHGILPGGAESALDLVGRAVEVRSGATVYLVGTVPDLATEDESYEGDGDLDGEGKSKGDTRLRSKPKSGSESIRIKVKHLEPTTSLAVQVAHPETGKLSTIGTIETNGGGNGKLRIRNKKGDPLPFGVASVSELSGLAVEVCDPEQDGLVVLTGVLP